MVTILFGLYQIFKKPWTFIITTAMLITGLIISFYSFLVYGSYHYPTRQAQKVLTYSIADVYKINFGITMLGLHSDDVEQVNRLFEELGNVKGVEAWGGYYTEYDNLATKLYISPSLMGLCDMRNQENKRLTFSDNGENKNYGEAFVGADLAEVYPVGSIYCDMENDCEYRVVDVIKEDSKWLSEDLYGGSATVLDDVIVLDLNYNISRHGNEINIANACNNLLAVGSGDNIKEDISDITAHAGVDIDGVISLRQLYSAYEKEAMDNAGESYMLPFILLFSAIVVSVITSKMSVMTNKRDYGIMLSNGFTKVNIAGIILTENIMKCICAFLVCILYWKIQYINMDDFARKLYDDMLFWRIGLFMIIFVVISLFPVKYVLMTKPYDLMNRKEL